MPLNFSLSKPELKQVWAIADSKRQGFLGLVEFIAAMQLLSLAQEGHELTSYLLKNTGKLLSFLIFYTNHPSYRFSEWDHLETLSPPSMECLDNFVEKHRVPKSNDHSEINGSTQPRTTSAKNLFSKKSKKKGNTSFASITSVVDGLKMLYNEKLKPLEATYLFNDFVSPA